MLTKCGFILLHTQHEVNFVVLFENENPTNTEFTVYK